MEVNPLITYWYLLILRPFCSIFSYFDKGQFLFFCNSVMIPEFGIFTLPLLITWQNHSGSSPMKELVKRVWSWKLKTLNEDNIYCKICQHSFYFFSFSLIFIVPGNVLSCSWSSQYQSLPTKHFLKGLHASNSGLECSGVSCALTINIFLHDIWKPLVGNLRLKTSDRAAGSDPASAASMILSHQLLGLTPATILQVSSPCFSCF